MVRPLVGITTYVTRATFGVWETESVLVPADLRRTGSSARVGGRCSFRRRTRGGGDAGCARRVDLLRRLRISIPSCTGRSRIPRPSALSPRATAPSWRCCRGARARHAGARDLPRLAGAQRRARRRSRPAPAGGRRQRAAQGHAGRVRRSRRDARGRDAARRVARRARAGEVASPSGIGRLGEGLRASGSRRRRRNRGDRGSSPAGSRSASCGIPKRART